MKPFVIARVIGPLGERRPRLPSGAARITAHFATQIDAQIDAQIDPEMPTQTTALPGSQNHQPKLQAPCRCRRPPCHRAGSPVLGGLSCMGHAEPKRLTSNADLDRGPKLDASAHFRYDRAPVLTKAATLWATTFST